MKTVLAALGLLSLPCAAAAQDMIAVGYARNVYSLDSASGQAVVIGFGFLGQSGLARDGGGTLWSTALTNWTSGPTNFLTRIEPANGFVTPMFVTLPFRSLASGPGTSLFALANATPSDLLHSIDTTNGQSVVIGSTGLANVVALVAHQGLLLGWDTALGLVVLSPTTGQATDVNPAVGGNNIAWLAVREDGALIGGGGVFVYSIDAVTGVAVVTSTTNGSLITGACASGLAYAIGSGCAGGGGLVNLTVSGALRAGTVLNAQSVGHGYTTLHRGALILGFSRVAHQGLVLPFDLDPVLGTIDCSLQTSIDSVLWGATSLGVLQFLVPLPSGLGGSTFFLQHAVFEPVPGGMSWSGAVRVHVGM